MPNPVMQRRLIARQGSFDARAYTNLAAWYAARKDTGYADSDSVGTAIDQSGNARHATQATAAKKPTYKTGIVNGLAVYRFDAVDDMLKTAAVLLTTTVTEYTIVAVVKCGAGGAVCAQEKSGTSNGVLLQQDRVDYHAADTGNVIALATASFSVVTMRISATGNAVDTWENGTSEHTDAVASTGTPNSTETTIGNRDGGSLPLGGDLAEIVIYSDAKSTAERQAIERALGALYGITVA